MPLPCLPYPAEFSEVELTELLTQVFLEGHQGALQARPASGWTAKAPPLADVRCNLKRCQACCASTCKPA